MIISSSHGSSIKEQDNVLLLNTDTFELAINSYPYLLVMFCKLKLLFYFDHVLLNFAFDLFM